MGFLCFYIMPKSLRSSPRPSCLQPYLKRRVDLIQHSFGFADQEVG
jgi:hypothetical protein